MAKQIGIFQFKGKLGQVVGRVNAVQQLTTVSSRHQNIVAMAPSVVSNPRTTLQASQRMRMRAAANFYRQIGFILNHSWQGTKYRAPSRNRFMQLALKKGNFAVPFLKRGDASFVPGEFPLSEGSLVGVDVTGIDGEWVWTSLVVSNAKTDTYGQLAKNIINNNAGVYNGDKLTFIFVVERWGGGEPFYDAVSLQYILDVDSTLEVDEPIFKWYFSTSHGRLHIGLSSIEGTDSWIKAAAVIHVRAPQSQGGSTAWQRSNTSMYVADSVLERFMSAEAFNEALASYQNENADVNSDWYLNTGAENNGGTSGDSSQPTLVTSYSFTSDGPLNGYQVALFGGAVIVNEDSSSLTLYSRVSSNTVVLLKRWSRSSDLTSIRSQISNASLSTVPLDEARAGGVVVTTSGGVVEDNP